MKKSSVLIGVLVAIVLMALCPFSVYAATDTAKTKDKQTSDEKDDSDKDESDKKDSDKESDEEEEEEEIDTRPDYVIRVNRLQDCVTIYEVEPSGKETPIKAMACSTGKNTHPTELGEFKLTDHYDWRLMAGDCYSQYAVRFYSKYLFHSVPYDTRSKDSLWTYAFNMLGEHASGGCIRLSVIDAKWIYDNCKEGTKVYIFDNENSPGPLGKPEPIRIDPKCKFPGWDPTDPDEHNPYIRQAKEQKAAEAYKEATLLKMQEWTDANRRPNPDSDEQEDS